MIKSNIDIENARIGFKNFAGKEGKFNAKGNRNFCVFLDHEFAVTLEREGWNVRWLTPKEEYDEQQAYLSVAVSFGNIPPKIFLVTSKGKTLLYEESVMVLDWAEIKNVDLTIRPYNWEVSGKTGVKAYIKSMYITIAEDTFESKYRDVPDSAVSSMIE